MIGVIVVLAWNVCCYCVYHLILIIAVFSCWKGAKKDGKSPDGSRYIECAESQDIKDLLK